MAGSALRKSSFTILRLAVFKVQLLRKWDLTKFRGLFPPLRLLSLLPSDTLSPLLCSHQTCSCPLAHSLGVTSCREGSGLAQGSLLHISIASCYPNCPISPCCFVMANLVYLFTTLQPESPEKGPSSDPHSRTSPPGRGGTDIHIFKSSPRSSETANNNVGVDCIYLYITSRCSNSF